MSEIIQRLGVKIFADGANVSGMREMYDRSYIKGLTTNPTLMNKAGIKNYKEFAIEVLDFVRDKPISFEVFSDEFSEMERQALTISGWGENVFVKIPVTNTQGKSSADLVKKLTLMGVKVNVTAVMTTQQVEEISEVLNPDVPSYVSIFAGRIADTGRDPVPYIQKSLRILQHLRACEIIWASPRELLNIFQANQAGCHVITATNDILAKLDMVNYSLTQYSLDTVNMFFRDSQLSGFEL